MKFINKKEDPISAFGEGKEPEFYDYLNKSKPTQLMVINFTTRWCKPCRKAKAPFENLAKKYKDVRFATVDVDYLMKIAEKLDVKMMPTFLLVKGRKRGRDQETDEEKRKKQGMVDHDQDKKETVQGDKEKQKNPVLNNKYEMLKLGEVVGYQKDNLDTIEKLEEMIKDHMYRTD